MAGRLWMQPLIGVAGAAVGLAPWLVHGMRLPLQNLGTALLTEEQAPIVLLPFSQYAVVQLAALLVLGGALAGLGSRLLTGGRSALHRILLLAGVLIVQVVAIVQTTRATGAVLQQRAESSTYLALLVAGSIASVLVGAAVLLLLTGRRRAAVVVGVALAAVLLPSWASTFVVAPVGLFEGPTWLADLPRWLAPIAVGLAVAWSGLRTPGRIAAAVFGAVALWVGPALVTALMFAVGSRVYARYPAEMARAGAQVFGQALGALEVVLPVLLVALVVAAIGLAVRGAVARRGAAVREG